jgi:hypothetical protein
MEKKLDGKELNKLLSEFAGIPEEKIKDAIKMQNKLHGGTNHPVALISIWRGGCLYELRESGNIHGKMGNWILVECVA